jgi:hypothetical protein
MQTDPSNLQPSSPPLPKTLESALKQERYRKGESTYSVTQLLSPPKKLALQRFHAGEIRVDPGKQMYSLMSSVLHELIESAATPEAIAHERFYHFIPQEEGAPPETISGEIDLAELGSDGEMTLYDFKSVFITAKGSAKPEYEAQLNILAWLMGKNGMPVSKLVLVHIFRDWRAVRASEDPEYPQSPWETIEVPIWPLESVEMLVKENAAKLREAYAANGDQSRMIPCTDEERWMGKEKYQAFKEGNKVHRLFATPEAAHDYINSRKTGKDLYEIKLKRGEPIRCIHFCEAAPFCHQFQSEQPFQPEQP